MSKMACEYVSIFRLSESPHTDNSASSGPTEVSIGQKNILKKDLPLN